MTTDLCTTASIRAVLGVSEKEIRDDVLLDSVYAVKLTERLYQLHASLVTDFKATAAISPKSDIQQRFVDVVQAYSAYYVANQCLGAVSMFAPAEITDGKSGMRRMLDPYKSLRADIPAALTFFLSSLAAAYLALDPTKVVTLPALARYTLATSAPLGTDPVTGV